MRVPPRAAQGRGRVGGFLMSAGRPACNATMMRRHDFPVGGNVDVREVFLSNSRLRGCVRSACEGVRGVEVFRQWKTLTKRSSTVTVAKTPAFATA